MGSSNDDPVALARGIIDEARVPEQAAVFQIGFGAKQVTLFAQQVRALRLIWALRQQHGDLDDKVIVIVGGGVAGVTAAAAAMLFGARVTLLEQNEELLHLQRGCHTRYLHPRIFDWPRNTARRASAGLPVMDWSVGTAHEVANTMLGELRRIAGEAGQQTFERSSVREVVIEGNEVSWRNASEPIRADAVILALGFGIENTVDHLPRRSYWRVDSLTQTGIDSLDMPYRVLVAGTGDGGIFDVLRAKLKEFDHGGFVDECMLRMQDDELIKRATLIESDFATENAADLERLAARTFSRQDADAKFAAWFDSRYRELEPYLTKLEPLFAGIRPDTQVVWTGIPKMPASHNAQPLNRLLGWAFYRHGGFEYIQGSVETVVPLLQTPTTGNRYQVLIMSNGHDNKVIEVHQVVVRYGADSALKRAFPRLHAALDAERRPITNVHELEPTIDEAFRSIVTNKPRASRRARADATKLHARPEYSKKDARTGKQTWRIRIWLDAAALAHVSWVDYELHCEYGAVRRRATFLEHADDGEHFRHWVNTADDYWVRVRCSDGFEVGCWLSDAIDAGEHANACRTDLVNEAVRLRSKDPTRSSTLNTTDPEYKRRGWCDHVDLELRETERASEGPPSKETL